MASPQRPQGRATLNKAPATIETYEQISSYIDWPAVFAGALVATASAMLLAGAGAALGLSFRPSDTSVETVGLAAAVWLAIITLYAAGVGGYISGRLRPSVTTAAPDEVSFRDGVNGVVVWALGVVLSVLLAGAAIQSAVSTVAQTGAAVTGGAAALGVTTAASTAGNLDYLIDRALRPSDAAPATRQTDGAEAQREITRILTVSAVQGSVANEDKQYLTRVVAARTGVSEAEARARIDTLANDAQAAAAKAADTAKNAADKARKAASLFGVLNTVMTLLAGVFAWYAARIGGFHRDGAY